MPLHYSSSAALGVYAFGTFNLVACGIGRSIEGAIFGGVVGMELYKVVAARSAAPLAIGVPSGGSAAIVQASTTSLTGRRQLALAP